MGFFDFLKPLFGSQSGVLTPFTSQVAKKAVGGTDNLSDAFIKATVGGGALDALSFAKDQAVSGLHDLGHKAGAELSKIPVIGGALQAGVQAGTGLAKGALESIPTKPAELGTSFRPELEAGAQLVQRLPGLMGNMSR